MDVTNLVSRARGLATLRISFPGCWIRRSQSIKIGIDLSIDKSIKFGKSELPSNIDCIDETVEIDDTIVSFIGRFFAPVTSAPHWHLNKKWPLTSCNNRFIDKRSMIYGFKITNFRAYLIFAKPPNFAIAIKIRVKVY